MLVVQWRTVVSSFDGEDCDALVSLSQKLQMSNLGDSQLGGRRTSPPHGVPDRYRFLLGAGAGVEKGRRTRPPHGVLDRYRFLSAPCTSACLTRLLPPQGRRDVPQRL